MTNKGIENFVYFKSMHTDVYKAYEAYGEVVHEQGGPIEEKTRWLIKVAISAAGQHDFSLRSHIHKALSVGCTRSEVEHAILLIAPTAGFPTSMEAIMVLRDELDKEVGEEEINKPR